MPAGRLPRPREGRVVISGTSCHLDHELDENTAIMAKIKAPTPPTRDILDLSLAQGDGLIWLLEGTIGWIQDTTDHAIQCFHICIREHQDITAQESLEFLPALRLDQRPMSNQSPHSHITSWGS